MEDRVYKIFTAGQWQTFQQTGRFGGSADDLRDGFIHLSTKAQVAGVIERFFSGIRPLIVAEFPASGLGGYLKWERSASGEFYPHLYAEDLVSSRVSAYTKV